MYIKDDGNSGVQDRLSAAERGGNGDCFGGRGRVGGRRRVGVDRRRRASWEL